MFPRSGAGYLVGFKHTAFPVILQTPSLLGSTSLLVTTPTQISAAAEVRRVVCPSSGTSLPIILTGLIFHFKNMGHLLQIPCTACKCPICHTPMKRMGATRVHLGLGSQKLCSSSGFLSTGKMRWIVLGIPPSSQGLAGRWEVKFNMITASKASCFVIWARGEVTSMIRFSVLLGGILRTNTPSPLFHPEQNLPRTIWGWISPHFSICCYSQHQAHWCHSTFNSLLCFYLYLPPCTAL